MPKKLLSLLGAVSIIAIYACRKEKSLEALITTTPCTYAPYTVGSSFIYQYINSKGEASLYTLTVRADTSINGKSYAILHDGYNSQFVRCDNGKYFLYEPPVSLEDYKLIPGDRLFLQDGYPAGATWTDTVMGSMSGVAQTGLLQYHILERDVEKTVMGKTYQNVIAVRQDAAVLMAGTTYPVGTVATYYYSPGVGYIETVSATDTIRLVNHSIH
ncbi:hypothetical protein [Chitinophaga rhizophila]|uniref:DUF4595 domain-containing protein n=1 Tax=Chitinophaga rhizophila TaxID=2866212 RepID=A0ABS7GER6_9BACT|nr:hypothetical protein [Chitinophaga rhizophila]MBW8686170.1 hypothetical protein [Chitinophaga rhizophila]